MRRAAVPIISDLRAYQGAISFRIVRHYVQLLIIGLRLALYRVAGGDSNAT